MELLTCQAKMDHVLQFLPEPGLEDVVPERDNAYGIITAGGIPRTNGKPKSLSSVRLLAACQLPRSNISQGGRILIFTLMELPVCQILPPQLFWALTR